MENNGVIKEIFVELAERFVSTENLQALETLLSYYEDFDFGLDEDDDSYVISYLVDSINTVS